jgi:hypothetical protein
MDAASQAWMPACPGMSVGYMSRYFNAHSHPRFCLRQLLAWIPTAIGARERNGESHRETNMTTPNQ